MLPDRVPAPGSSAWGAALLGLLDLLTDARSNLLDRGFGARMLAGQRVEVDAVTGLQLLGKFRPGVTCSWVVPRPGTGGYCRVRHLPRARCRPPAFVVDAPVHEIGRLTLCLCALFELPPFGFALAPLALLVGLAALGAPVGHSGQRGEERSQQVRRLGVGLGCGVGVLFDHQSPVTG